MNDHIKEISYAKDTRTGGSSASVSRTMSYFARGTYSYDSRYLFPPTPAVTATRLSASHKRWAQFWSVGASPGTSTRRRFYDVDWLKVMKLKATYGTSGNSRIDTSVAAGHIPTMIPSYIGVTGATLSTVPNPGLSWETTRR